MRKLLLGLCLGLYLPASACAERVEQTVGDVCEIPHELTRQRPDLSPGEWRETFARAGHAGVQFDLGSRLFGRGETPADKITGLYWLSRSARQGCTRAQYRLGQAYDEGDTLSADTDTAFWWYHQAEAGGLRQAADTLLQEDEIARSWRQEFVVPAEHADWYRAQAEAGNAWAAWRMAKFHFDTEAVGVDFDATEMVRWLEQAGGAGHVMALTLHGDLLSHRWVAADFEQAISRDTLAARQLYRRAIDLGYAPAAGHYAETFAAEVPEGKEIVSPAAREAIYWWRLCAEAGEPECQEHMAAAHETGYGGTRIDEEAAQDWRMARWSGERRTLQVPGSDGISIELRDVPEE